MVYFVKYSFPVPWPCSKALVLHPIYAKTTETCKDLSFFAYDDAVSYWIYPLMNSQWNSNGHLLIGKKCRFVVKSLLISGL